MHTCVYTRHLVAHPFGGYEGFSRPPFATKCEWKGEFEETQRHCQTSCVTPIDVSFPTHLMSQLKETLLSKYYLYSLDVNMFEEALTWIYRVTEENIEVVRFWDERQGAFD